MGGPVLAKVDYSSGWYDLHMVNRSVVAKNSEDLYPKSLEAMANEFVSPWVVVISLIRSGRLVSVADQSSLLYSESYLRQICTDDE